ncbi:MAG TPA: lysine transporter LysE [Exiguobacterium sp.]|uniref:LysE family translocator n=1 Tax=Exiguobacterium TaxID=33986 RepID=UPI000EE9746E|nr:MULTISPECIES: LysE family transporter [Exiguobacterium]MDW2884567.1 LysE family transporter [Exiguobacterium sibiricum]HCN58304.1 lysine transporter LysE [Exiguobacterium sp.]
MINGFWIGLAIAAPVGPIGLLCMKRTLQFGRRYGFFSGLGAATADLIYGLIALSGLSVIQVFVTHTAPLQIAGSLFLCYFGVRTLKSTTAVPLRKPTSSLTVAYGSTLFLTLMNPVTIIAFLAILARFQETTVSPISLLIGIFLGSAGWWLFLSQLMHLLKKQLSPAFSRSIQYLSAVLLISFGIYGLYELLV